ncbi:hypothetical protein SS50377_20854 [Spironucleus salmonicida]|nr:hypothetical protein SS50377_20854 [Spironucleus salmonicida]
MKINTSVLNEKYFNFTESIIQLPDTIFITTSSDQINSLYISSLQACPISPNGEMQTSSSTCQISVPIGMTTKGINGRGNIGQSVGILATMLFMTTSNNRTFYDKKFVIQQATLIKKQPLSYQQQQYIEGYGFGFTDYKAINLANSHYYQQNKQTQLSLLVKGNIKNGDILNIGSFQLIKIQVTLRGNQDLFEENYENIASTHMQSNTGQEALKYNDISVWIILLDGTEQIPHYIGTYFIEQANQKSTLNYILDQSNFNGFYVQDYIQVLFSYSKTRSQVIQEIKDKTQINTDLIVSLQIFGVKKNIQFTIFNAHQKLYQRNNIYFISNVSYHYMICHYGRNLLFRQLDVQTENNIKKVKLDTLGLCALVLCETEQMKNHLIQQSPFCTSSNEIIVEDFIIAITFSTLIYIITFLLLLTILPVFLYSKVNSNDDSDQSS